MCMARRFTLLSPYGIVVRAPALRLETDRFLSRQGRSAARRRLWLET